jgi:ERCC4-related helicase
LLTTNQAHNCTGKHPGSRVMREFYREAKDKGNPVPHILGLTASPVNRADRASLEKLENTLDGCCKSPTRHREELLAHTRRPSMFNIQYLPSLKVSQHEYTQSMSKINKAYKELDIREDPYVIELCHQNTKRSERKLQDAFIKRNTYVQATMKKFCRKSVDICQEMGSWAADWYIFEAIRRFLDGFRRQDVVSQSYKEAEAAYLARIFQNARIAPPLDTHDAMVVSEKVTSLIDVLLRYESGMRGIVFAKERST